MSSNTYPANIDISGAQRAALISAGLLPAGSTASRVNPSSPKCNPPATVYAEKGPGGAAGCSYDYMEDTEIYPDSRKIGFIGRATFQLIRTTSCSLSSCRRRRRRSTCCRRTRCASATSS